MEKFKKVLITITIIITILIIGARTAGSLYMTVENIKAFSPEGAKIADKNYSAEIIKLEKEIKSGFDYTEKKLDLVGAYLITGQKEKALKLLDEIEEVDSKKAIGGRMIAYYLTEDFEKALTHADLYQREPKPEICDEECKLHYQVIRMIKTNIYRRLKKYPQFLWEGTKVFFNYFIHGTY